MQSNMENGKEQQKEKWKLDWMILEKLQKIRGKNELGKVGENKMNIKKLRNRLF